MKTYHAIVLIVILYALIFCAIFKENIAPPKVLVVSNEIVKCEAAGGRLSMVYSDWYETYQFTCSVSAKTLYKDLR